MSRNRPIVWSVRDLTSWVDGDTKYIDYVAGFITQVETLEGKNKQGNPYKLLKLSIEDDSYPGSITCALWDDARSHVQPKLTKDVPVCLSNLLVSQWRGVRQLSWRSGISKLYTLTDAPPCTEVGERLSTLHRRRNMHRACPTQDDKPMTPEEAQGMYGPIGVAAALQRIKQGHLGSLRVRAYITEVEVAAEEGDTLRHGSRLIKARCDMGGATTWQYRRLWLTIRDKPVDAASASAAEVLRVRVDDPVAQALFANIPAQLLASECEENRSKGAAEPCADVRDGEEDGQESLSHVVEDLLSSLCHVATGPLLLRLRSLGEPESQESADRDCESQTTLLEGLWW